MELQIGGIAARLADLPFGARKEPRNFVPKFVPDSIERSVSLGRLIDSVAAIARIGIRWRGARR
jgi:hypothetical protein